MVALVDDEDFEFVSQWVWFASLNSGNYYARRDVRIGGIRHRIYMHRVLAGSAPGQNVDHRDHCTLNNQRQNLRTCSQIQNMGNCQMQSSNKSGFKGVSWNLENQKWVAQISMRPTGKKFLGRFLTAQEAAAAYDEFAIKKYGEFALTNKALGLLN